MMASACLAAQLPPQAFGVEPEDVPAVAAEMMELLQEQMRQAKADEMLAKLKARH